MDIEDAAEGPAAGDLFYPTVGAVEKDRLPHAKKLERLTYIVVRAPVIQAGEIWVGLLRIRRGAYVHALRPGELSIGHELMRELMFYFSEHRIVVTSTGDAPEIPAAYLRVEGETLGCRDGKRVLMEEGVTRQAPLVSQGRYELVAQIVLGIQRVVMNAQGRQRAGEDAEGNLTGCWEPIRAKARNRVRVRWITVQAMRIRREGIDNAAVRQRLCASRRVVELEHGGHPQPWIS